MASSLTCGYCKEKVSKPDWYGHIMDCRKTRGTFPDDFIDKDALRHDKEARQDFQKQCDRYWRDAPDEGSKI